MSGNVSNPQKKKLASRIFLVGFMGSGKSYWGKIWAEETGYTFTDLDEIIEKAEQSSIHTIFEKKGEVYFRQTEAILLRSMQQENTIIACGGGTPCYYDNMQWINKNGCSIWLQATTNDILKNIQRGGANRPLLKGLDEKQLQSYITNSLKEREQYYSMAAIGLPVSTLNRDVIQSLFLYNN